MRSELKSLKERFNEIKEILNEVHSAIIGNPLTKDGGMAARLIMAEEELERLKVTVSEIDKKQIKYNLYTRLMWVMGGAIISIVFAYILQLIFKKPI